VLRTTIFVSQATPTYSQQTHHPEQQQQSGTLAHSLRNPQLHQYQNVKGWCLLLIALKQLTLISGELTLAIRHVSHYNWHNQRNHFILQIWFAHVPSLVCQWHVTWFIHILLEPNFFLKEIYCCNIQSILCGQ
jgi:hypothetical protein